MKFSIIVPIYNVEKYLPQCIDSILNQDYKDFELILVNDGSPDDSLSICRQYAEKDKRVRIINKPNGGSTSSRKAGAKIAKGEYVICVDSDDYVEQGYFSCVARSLDEFNPDIVVLSHYSLEGNKKILNKDFVVQDLLQDKDICLNVCTSCNSSLGTRVDASLLNQSITKYMRYKFKIRGKNGIPNPFKGIEVKYADTSIVGELKVDKEGKINGFRAKHQVLECNKEKLIVGPRKGFASYVNSKLNENGMNPVTEKELLENRIDFNEHKIPHVEFVEFPEEMRSQYLLYAFPTMLKMAYEYCFITFGEKYLKNPIAMNIRDFLIKYDYKKDTEYCSPTIASLMWISEEERKISLKMYIDNDNIWVQIVLWGMILANICMLEEVFEDEMKIDSGLSVEM